MNRWKAGAGSAMEGWRAKGGERERERMHEETGDRKGGNTKEGGVRDEGEKGWAWWASESKVRYPLVWQLPACTLLFSWLSASTPSLRLDCCLFKWDQGFPRLHTEVGCFTCDVDATTERARWSGCVSVCLLRERVTVQQWQTLGSQIDLFPSGSISSSCHCWVVHTVHIDFYYRTI